MLLQYRVISVGFLITCISGASFANDINGNFAVRGVGSAGCNQYTEAYEQGNTETLERVLHWTQGYISARNKMTEGTFDTIPTYRVEDILALINVVCLNNQDSQLETATSSIIDLFEPVWLSASSNVSTLEADGQSLPLRDGVLRQVQQALADQGFYDSTVDGVFGARSATALRAFQSSEGLTETGLPDLATLMRLLLDSE